MVGAEATGRASTPARDATASPLPSTQAHESLGDSDCLMNAALAAIKCSD